MNALTPALPVPSPRRRAASLTRTAAGYLRSFWDALERQGQRRAAPELSRLGHKLADSDPEVSAHLIEQSRRWSGR